MANTIKYSLKVGNSSVHIEAEGVKKLFLLSGFFASIPGKCGNCKSENLILNGTKNAGYEFYGCLCRDCKHELKCGQRKEDGGLFWKLDDGWVAPYKKEGGGERREERREDRRPPEDEDDDIPF